MATASKSRPGAAWTVVTGSDWVPVTGAVRARSRLGFTVPRRAFTARGNRGLLTGPQLPLGKSAREAVRVLHARSDFHIPGSRHRRSRVTKLLSTSAVCRLWHAWQSDSSGLVQKTGSSGP